MELSSEGNGDIDILVDISCECEKRRILIWKLMRGLNMSSLCRLGDSRMDVGDRRWFTAGP